MGDVSGEILSLKKKLLGMRVKKSNGDLKDTSQIKKMRKAIARLFTKRQVGGTK